MAHASSPDALNVIVASVEPSLQALGSKVKPWGFGEQQNRTLILHDWSP